MQIKADVWDIWSSQHNSYFRCKIKIYNQTYCANNQTCQPHSQCFPACFVFYVKMPLKVCLLILSLFRYHILYKRCSFFQYIMNFIIWLWTYKKYHNYYFIHEILAWPLVRQEIELYMCGTSLTDSITH